MMKATAWDLSIIALFKIYKKKNNNNNKKKTFMNIKLRLRLREVILRP